MKESKLHIMESMDVKKAIIKLALPTMLAMIVQIIYNLTDTFFVGRLNDANQVAALSLVFPIFLFIISVGNIFANGGASYISRCLGEKKYDEAKKNQCDMFLFGYNFGNNIHDCNCDFYGSVVEYHWNQ